MQIEIANITFDSIQGHFIPDSSGLHSEGQIGRTVNTGNITDESGTLSKRKHRRKANPQKRGRKPKKAPVFKDYEYHFDFPETLLIKLRSIQVGKLTLEECPRSFELALKMLYYVACNLPARGWMNVNGVAVPRAYFKALGYGSDTINKVFSLLFSEGLLIITREADRNAIDKNNQGVCRHVTIPDTYRTNFKIPDKVMIDLKAKLKPLIKTTPELDSEMKLFREANPDYPITDNDLKALLTSVEWKALSWIGQ